MLFAMASDALVPVPSTPAAAAAPASASTHTNIHTTARNGTDDGFCGAEVTDKQKKEEERKKRREDEKRKTVLMNSSGSIAASTPTMSLFTGQLHWTTDASPAPPHTSICYDSPRLSAVGQREGAVGQRAADLDQGGGDAGQGKGSVAQRPGNVGQEQGDCRGASTEASRWYRRLHLATLCITALTLHSSLSHGHCRQPTPVPAAAGRKEEQITV